MQLLDQDLCLLVERAQSQGYLTYEEVGAYLPDVDVTPEKLDNLLAALDERGIEIREVAPGAGPLAAIDSRPTGSRRRKA